jgi:uncharacterized protein YvpB
LNKWYIYFLCIMMICFGLFLRISAFSEEQIEEGTPNKESLLSTANAKEVAKLVDDASLPNETLLDVPLLKQLDSPRLYNGCEVTSLAMILNFWGIEVSKNDLANQIKHVPLNYNDGTNGNPNVGFVGNMEDGPGLGVYHGPIFDLAQIYGKDKIEDLTKQPFSTLLENVAHGLPVWVITTTSFSPVSSLESWTTPEGTVDITYNMHSVVITGYNQESIFINDPYGTKNKQVDRQGFIKAWEQMGSQAIVIKDV